MQKSSRPRPVCREKEMTPSLLEVTCREQDMFAGAASPSPGRVSSLCEHLGSPLIQALPRCPRHDKCLGVHFRGETEHHLTRGRLLRRTPSCLTIGKVVRDCHCETVFQL